MIEQNASANPEAAQVRATDVDHKPGDDSTPRNPDPAAPENRPKTNAEAIADAKENNPLFQGEKTDQRRAPVGNVPDMSVNNNSGAPGENLDGSPNPALGLRHGFDPKTGLPLPGVNQPQPVTKAKEPFVGKIPVDDKGRPISSAKSWDDMSTDEKLDQLKRRLDASDRLNAARPRGGIYPGL